LLQPQKKLTYLHSNIFVRFFFLAEVLRSRSLRRCVAAAQSLQRVLVPHFCFSSCEKSGDILEHFYWLIIDARSQQDFVQVADAPKDIVQVVPATKHRRLKSLGRCFALRTVHCAVEVVAANIAIDEAQVRDKEIANGPAGSPLMQPAAAREQGTVAHPDRRLGPSNKHLIDGSRRQASGLAFRSLAAEACLSEMLSRVFSCALRVNVWGVLYLEPLI